MIRAEIITPQKAILNGLWCGPSSDKATKGKPKKPKRVIVWVHGLGSSMWSKLGIVEKLVDSTTAVLVFNNRGHDVVARISTTGKKRIQGGAAHEVFTDCVDDIQGAVNLAKQSGAKEIFLAGHSTGCQKSVYWASKKRGVRGIILLAPISDYSAEVKLRGNKRVVRAALAARALVGRGKKHTLLPENIWHETLDAQRFLSLYTGKGAEEIFTYWNPAVNPRTLKSVKIPLLTLLAESDEFADRPAKKIEDWFLKYAKKQDATHVISRVAHSFSGGESRVARLIRDWMKIL